MTEAPKKKSSIPWLPLLAAAMAPLLMDSCSSTPKIQGLPDKLPDIALNGSSATPPTNLPGYEYPFDSGGNYVSNWAADGERRAGRPASATNDDERKWSSSHRGHVTSKSPKKSSKKGSGKSSGSSSKKKSSSDDDDKPKAKSGSKSSKKTPSKSGSGTSSKKKSSKDDDDKPKAKSKSKSSGSSTKKKKSDN